MFTALLFMLLQAAPAAIPADLAAELKSIKAEQTEVGSSEKALATERADIAKEEVHITDTEELLERGIKTFENERDAVQKDGAALLDEAERLHTEQRAYVRLEDDFNRRCDGTFEEAYYNACVAEKQALLQRFAELKAWGQRVEAWRDRVLAKRPSLDKQQEMLDQINTTLFNDKNALEDRKEALQKSVDNLEAMKSRLNDRLTGALARLAHVNALSGDCAELAKKITPESCRGKGDPSDPANWNTPCELASRCFAKAFDGAR